MDKKSLEYIIECLTQECSYFPIGNIHMNHYDMTKSEYLSFLYAFSYAINSLDMDTRKTINSAIAGEVKEFFSNYLED